MASMASGSLSSSSAAEPSLIHFGDDSASASPHQQQAQTKRRTETVDDLLS